jgi:hypothetical protein
MRDIESFSWPLKTASFVLVLPMSTIRFIGQR